MTLRAIASGRETRARMARVFTIVLVVVILAQLALRRRGVADDLAGNLASFCEVEQACLLTLIFWDAGCGSACRRRSCPVLGRVASEWPFDCNEHGIVFRGALDVVGDPCCVPGASHSGDHLMGFDKKGHVANTRQIFNEKRWPRRSSLCRNHNHNQRRDARRNKQSYRT